MEAVVERVEPASAAEAGVDKLEGVGACSKVADEIGVRVAARPAILKCVGPRAAEQRVGSAAADERVVPAASFDAVCQQVAAEEIIEGAAENVLEARYGRSARPVLAAAVRVALVD